MILMIDNYDSFTYNLVQYLGELDPVIEVWRNDSFSLSDIEELNPNHIVLSPGPGKPSQAGLCLKLIERYYASYPILGICLGHQAICEYFGARIIRAPEIVHGKISSVKHRNSKLMNGLPNPVKVTRYHSLITESATIPESLKVVATVNNLIMAVEHVNYPVFGLQFHPESIASENGKQMLHNFLNIEDGYAN